MTKLRLGVIDVPYTSSVTASGKLRKASLSVETTGDVAEILEGKYHVFQHFFEAHGQEIADALTQSVGEALGDVLSGIPVATSAFTTAEGDIKTAFVKFIDSKEMDSLGYPGIPTKASLKGVNHRFKHPYAKGNPARPSFVDTGAYEDNFHIEVGE